MFELGEIVGGKYCLEQEIGEGGVATVWRAVHMELDRPVAVKLLRLVSTKSPEQVRDRFLREARLAASVRHRNVVDIIDFGTTDSGVPYMVMELLEGQSLAEHLSDGPVVAEPELVRILASSLKGLQAVHAAGIVHRDLKPENIFLVRDSDGSLYPKLLDFGISKVDGDKATLRSSVPTQENLIVGTPHYMSPEQARGLKDIDHRTDIYSMGVILYELLTGRFPYDSENPGDLIVLVTAGGAPVVSRLRPDLGAPLSTVIARAMSKEREARYPDALAMRSALLYAVDETAAAVPGWEDSAGRSRASTIPPSGRHTPREHSSRRGIGLWVVAGAAALGAAAGIGMLTQAGGASEGAEHEPRAVTPPVAVAIAADDEEPGGERAAETVTVRLQGMPQEAEIRVDGRPSGSVFELPRAERTHVIEVSADGFHTWRMGHVATADAVYDVELELLPAAPAERSRPRHRQRRRPREAASSADGQSDMEVGMGRETGTPFEDPGF